MTEKDKYILKREKQLDNFKLKVFKLTEKAKQKKQKKKTKYLSEIKKVRGKFRTAKNRLKKLREADVLQWEKRRIKARDSLWDIRGDIDRLNIKIK